ncbi:RluA family pseudouridine synthase [Gemella cuniculi]|uniref:RluA family pseudouridine synthase n=1 Tax=Gemella cuniculi TaxID=150240 RepID=UPI000424432F|nr:RluA family pseudouridine synthase [Gemella cuniculi]
MSSLILKYIVKKEQVLRDFLLVNNISRKTLTRIKFDSDGSIKVNGKEENVRYNLKVNDIVELTLPGEEFSPNVRFIRAELDIVYEDEYFLIVNKTNNLPTIPSRNLEASSLLEEINFYFKKNNYGVIPHIVTRLDKNTTGLVLIAKHRHLHALFSKINIEKYYLALVEGKLENLGIIEANIKRKEDSIITRYVDPSGDYAKTQFWCKKYSTRENISLVKLKLFTGRTHQIRVHMGYLGHPLLGDELYGGNSKFLNRQAPHCNNLKFSHPITKEEIDVKAPIPFDMNTVIEKYFFNFL